MQWNTLQKVRIGTLDRTKWLLVVANHHQEPKRLCFFGRSQSTMFQGRFTVRFRKNQTQILAPAVIWIRYTNQKHRDSLQNGRSKKSKNRKMRTIRIFCIQVPDMYVNLQPSTPSLKFSTFFQTFSSWLESLLVQPHKSF